MNIRIVLLYFLLGILFYQCKTQQFEVGSERNGKCFGKCLIQEEMVTETEEYLLYTGNEYEENVNVITKEIVIQPATSKWIKKKADKHCLSADPNDCMVWCLVNEEPIVRTVRILEDTTLSKNYIVEKVQKDVKRTKGRFFEWKEVVCAQHISKSLISEIQNSLKRNQYYLGEKSGVFDESTKKALMNFQQKNNLPIGQLDFETLDVLGVVME